MGQGYAQSIPQTTLEQMLGSAGRGIGSVRKLLNKAGIPGIETGMNLGDMMLGQGPELLDEMSWGKSLIIPSGHGGRLDPRLMDVVDAAGLTGLLAKPAKAFIKGGLEDMVRQAPRAQAEGGYITRAPQNFNTIRALSMKEAGKTDDEIWEATKVFTRDPGGKPLIEVSHKDEIYKTSRELGEDWKNSGDVGDMNRITDMMTSDVPLADRVTNSVLADLYPEEAARTTINNMLPSNRSALGTYSRDMSGPDEIPGKHRISTKQFKDSMREIRTVEHETQHAISGHGGLSKGASMAGMKQEIRSNLLRRKNKIHDIPLSQRTAKNYHDVREIDNLLLDIEDQGNKLVSRVYRNNADEVRARLAPNRSELSQKQMDADPFHTKLGDLDLQIQIDPETNIIQNKSLLDDMINKSLIPYDVPAETTMAGKTVYSYRNPKYAK